MFDGDETKYELWEVKFLGHMRLQKLYHVIVPGEGEEGPPDVDKNADAFAELVQCLDDRSLSLVIRDAKDDGRKALKILQEHYLGRGKPRIISLYTELTSLKMSEDECVTDYMIRAETAANSLKTAGETISDSLLITMVLKGLPSEFKTFSTVVTQKEKPMTFAEFKVALRSFEETEKCQQLRYTGSNREDSVLKTKEIPARSNITCFSCGKRGHKSFECRNRDSRFGKNRWCEKCKNRSHDTKFCRKKDHARAVNDNESEHSFFFRVSVESVDSVYQNVSNDLLVDCGATAHIINDESKFVNFDDSFDTRTHYIELADGSKTNGIVSGRGDACILLYDVNGNPQNVTLKKALYIPSYKQDIFSVQAAIGNGASVNFSPKDAKLRAPDGTVFDIEKRGRLYYLNNTISSKSSTHSLEEWHKILGHCNKNDVLKLENVVKGMKISKKGAFDCEVCVRGKMVQHRNREPDERAASPLELVHCDLAGPVDPVAKEGFRYAMSFVDDYSGTNMIYFLKKKSDSVAATERFLADCAPYGKVKRMRTDNGTEFTCGGFKNLLDKNQIKHEKSAPYSPHQNGTVERGWRSIFEMARCLLLEAKLPKTFWTYAVMASVYIRNRCFNTRLEKTPYEAFTGQKPNLGNMHVFGTACFAYVQDKKKLDARSEKGVFVGYDKGSPAYLVYFPERGDIRRVRCVKFNDKIVETNDELETFYKYGGQKYETNKEDERNENIVGEHRQDHEIPVDDVKEDEVTKTDPEEISSQRYPQRQRNRPKYLEDYATDPIDSTKCTIDYCYRMADIPSTYPEAITSSESSQWLKAMNDEMFSLEDNDTYDLVPLPENRCVVDGKWVYAVKIGPNGEEKHKARYVAKGYSQIENVDYEETFSPTARITSIRMLTQLAVQNDMVVHQMDVKTAYLNAPIDCEIYVKQAEGFEKKGENDEQLVCRLKKSLYGLKQSGRNWNSMLHMYLIKDQFEQSLADPCVYYKITDDSVIIVIIWVDDIIIAASSNCTLNQVKHSFNQQFKMRDLGKLKWFLAIEFRCEKDCIEMTQTKYLKKILQKFKMDDCKPRATPCEMGVNKIPDDDSTLADPKLYREIVGSLIYVMTGTRPDLCYIVTKLSQHMAKPLNSHLVMAKHVLRYLKGSIDQGLKFQKSSNALQLSGYCDSDWGASEDRRSISGYGFQLSEAGPLISWKSQKQKSVALSTCEAEYMALATATQEARFLRQLFADMTAKDKDRVILHVDNQSAIALAKNPVHHQRSKHIDIKYHFVRSELQNNVIQLEYIPSECNVADVFTKPVSRVRLDRFVNIMGM